MAVPYVDPAEAKLGIGAIVEQDGDLWMITLRPTWTLLRGIFGLAVLSVALWAGYYFHWVDSVISTCGVIVVVGIAVLFGISIQRKAKYPEQVGVDSSDVSYRYRERRRGWVTKNISIRSIRDISLKSDTADSRGRSQVVIESSSGMLWIGRGLSSKTKRRLKALILSLVAEAITKSWSRGFDEKP